jgi:putative copper resistance protein D
MAGSLSDLADAETLWARIRGTGFGNVWTVRMLPAVIIVSVTAAAQFRKAGISWDLVLLILAAVFLASLAGTGRTLVGEEWASIVDAAHLLAAGLGWEVSSLSPISSPPMRARAATWNRSIRSC